MVRIRLRRMGLRSRPTYRVVAIDSRKARDSSYLESVGSYDPRSKRLNLNTERINYWLTQGAQPSDTVSSLIRRYEKEHPPVSESVAPADEPAAAEETASASSGETSN